MIKLYREWLLSKPELVAKAKQELRGKMLACWCSPLACHGDVLAEVANSDAVNRPENDTTAQSTSHEKKGASSSSAKLQ